MTNLAQAVLFLQITSSKLSLEEYHHFLTKLTAYLQGQKELLRCFEWDYRQAKKDTGRAKLTRLAHAVGAQGLDHTQQFLDWHRLKRERLTKKRTI